LNGGSDSGFKVILFGFRGVEDFDRVNTAGNIKKRSIVKVFLELFSVHSSRHDDKLQI